MVRATDESPQTKLLSFDNVTVKPVTAVKGVQASRRKRKNKGRIKKKVIDKKLVQAKKKYDRGAPVATKLIKSKKLRSRMKRQEEQTEAAVDAAARAEILLPSEAGYLEAEGMEKTWRFSQDDLKPHLDQRTKKKVFELDLPDFGPYTMDYTRNGRHLLLGGEKGHLAMVNWSDFKLNTELQLGETIRDVKFLHNESMFAVAQKKYVYVYDNSGIELHCLRKHVDVNRLEFLPYHFLLVTVGRTGFLKYIDTSTGENVAEHRTKLGECKVLKQNPRNAVSLLGHHNGQVTMWSPNVTTPLVKMFCHKAPILDLDVSVDGHYMATSGLDGQARIWDLRTYKQLHSYYTVRPASSVTFSHMGMLALGYGPHVQVWKDTFVEKQKAPYMVHRLPGKLTQRVRFCPFEDVLGVAHSEGFTSVVIPGAGEPNFDTFENNPFQTRKQKRENTVHSLLEKLQPSMITLDPSVFGLMEKDTKVVVETEAKAAAKLAKRDAEVEMPNKQRGRNRSSKRWKRRRKNVVDQNYLDRKAEIQAGQKKLQENKKKRIREKHGHAKSALDRFS